ncbi:MAG: hypothetical protein ACRYF5_13525 [Janthinobacterium lividum]
MNRHLVVLIGALCATGAFAQTGEMDDSSVAPQTPMATSSARKMAADALGLPDQPAAPAVDLPHVPHVASVADLPPVFDRALDVTARMEAVRSHPRAQHWQHVDLPRRTAAPASPTRAATQGAAAAARLVYRHESDAQASENTVSILEVLALQPLPALRNPAAEQLLAHREALFWYPLTNERPVAVASAEDPEAVTVMPTAQAAAQTTAQAEQPQPQPNPAPQPQPQAPAVVPVLVQREPEPGQPPAPSVDFMNNNPPAEPPAVASDSPASMLADGTAEQEDAAQSQSRMQRQQQSAGASTSGFPQVELLGVAQPMVDMSVPTAMATVFMAEQVAEAGATSAALASSQGETKGSTAAVVAAGSAAIVAAGSAAIVAAGSPAFGDTNAAESGSPPAQADSLPVKATPTAALPSRTGLIEKAMAHAVGGSTALPADGNVSTVANATQDPGAQHNTQRSVHDSAQLGEEHPWQDSVRVEASTRTAKVQLADSDQAAGQGALLQEVEVVAVAQPQVDKVGWISDLSTEMKQVAFGDSRLLAASDSKLDGLRGGFDGGNGLQVSFGITRVAYINGALATTNSLTIADVGKITADQAAQLNKQAGGINVVQNGPNNQYLGNPSGSLPGTVIQNTLNNQTITTKTVIDASANSAGILRNMNLQRTLNDAVGSGLRR